MAPASEAATATSSAPPIPTATLVEINTYLRSLLRFAERPSHTETLCISAFHGGAGANMNAEHRTGRGVIETAWYMDQFDWTPNVPDLRMRAMSGRVKSLITHTCRVIFAEENAYGGCPVYTERGRAIDNLKRLMGECISDKLGVW